MILTRTVVNQEPYLTHELNYYNNYTQNITVMSSGNHIYEKVPDKRLFESCTRRFLRTECWGYLDQKGRKTDRGENCKMMNFTACMFHQILLGWLNQGRWGGMDMRHAWGRGEVFTGFLVRSPEGRRPLGRPTHR